MDYDNHIIDFVNNNEFCLGLVTKVQKGKLVVQDAGGRSRKVREKQVMVLHDRCSENDFNRRVEELRQDIAATADAVDTSLLWEMVTESEGDAGLAAMTREYFDSNNALEMSAMARALLNDSLRFRWKSLTFSPRTRDDVAQLELQRRREAERAAWEKMATALLQSILGQETGHRTAKDDQEASVLRQVEAYVLQGQESEIVDLLEKAVSNQTARETGVTVLERTHRLPAGADPFLLANGVLPGFSHTVIEHVSELREYQPAFPGQRADLTPLETFSIDDEETCEVDDALSVKTTEHGTRVGIHIADPAVFVEKDDPVDRAARQRPLSLYLPTTALTMLPETIGTRLASLEKDHVRPSLSFLVSFDAEGNLGDWSLKRGQIRVRRRLTYKEADRILEQDAHPLSESLAELDRISAALRRDREAGNAVRLVRPELKIRVEGDRITVEEADPESASHRLVSELMILANRLAADHALGENLPFIFRTQERPAAELVPMERYDPVLFERQVKTLRRTRLSTQPLPHAGLGLELYTQVTSPIRRYADLVLQRQMGAHLDGTALPYTAEELVEVLGAADTMERESRRLQREAEHYWILEYIRRTRIGHSFEGTVVKSARNYTLVELDNLWVRGKLNAATRHRAGDRLQVKVSDAVPSRGLLVLDPENN